MAKVYITNASMNQISKSLRTKNTYKSRNDMLEAIVEDTELSALMTKEQFNEIFNNNDLKDFYFMKMMLKDFSQLIATIQGNKNIITEYISTQNKKYAYQVKAPAYHKNISCQWMHKSFNNIQIPQNCLSDIQSEQKAKEWINTNRNLPFNELNAKFKIEFNCKEGLEEISKANSSYADFENDKLEATFQKEVKTKYRQLRFFLDGDFAKKVANFKYAPSYKIQDILKDDKDEDTHKTLLDFHSVKDAIKKIIFDFYKSKYNAELSFEDTILDSIGFKKCSSNECNETENKVKSFSI
ncbi:MAG: hypothetical protein PHS42_02790 [Sulfurimonas sp.]|nr:hypothetical protein [Sulfurimonas sp.]